MANSIYGQFNHLWQIQGRDLNSNIEEEAWDEVVSNTGWPVGDLQFYYKVIHRYYYIPVKRH